ncbi:MAG TPA: flagellar filament capping protein FliD [Bryobacteraceae bacterium]|nr:flagellar filament capping protein FliD [Bryobacteraceae bacterium]
MSTSSIPSLGTTVGGSTFGPDLQNALNRAIAIASLPIQQMTSEQQQIQAQSTELNTISGLFTTLQSDLQSFPTGSGSSGLAAAVSDQTVLQANLTGSSLQGSYSIKVLDPGSSSTALSKAGSTPVTDPTTQNISSSTSFTLTVGTTNYTITPGSQNLNALAAGINSSGAPVQATIVNLGSPSAPDYRLALQSTELGNIALQLNDGTTNFMTAPSPGASASYTINGQPPGGITSNTDTVTIAPGLNVTLEKAGTATVTVSANTSALSNALNSFVSDYNAVLAELQKQHGQSAGPLAGDSTVLTMQTSLRQLANYTGGSGSITSLTQLGIQFTQQGTLSFDSTALSGLSSAQISDAFSFLGDPNTGGYLQSATNTLKGLLDPTTGVIPNEAQNLQTQNQHEAQAISAAQDRVNQLNTNLTAQMAAADALIATLQNQTQFIDGLFQIPTLNSNGTIGNNGSSGG